MSRSNPRGRVNDSGWQEQRFPPRLRLLGISPGGGICLVKIGFEDRFKHQHAAVMQTESRRLRCPTAGVCHGLRLGQNS